MRKRSMKPNAQLALEEAIKQRLVVVGPGTTQDIVDETARVIGVPDAGELARYLLIANGFQRGRFSTFGVAGSRVPQSNRGSAELPWMSGKCRRLCAQVRTAAGKPIWSPKSLLQMTAIGDDGLGGTFVWITGDPAGTTTVLRLDPETWEPMQTIAESYADFLLWILAAEAVV